MEEIGVIKQVKGIMAIVIVQKKGACEGCAASGVCSPSESGMEIEALNPVGAKERQTVKVSIKPQAYLKGTLIVYGLPLVAFIAGAILGKNIGETYLKNMNSDVVSVIIGFAALASGFLIVKAWSKKTETNIEYKPVIEEILDTESLSQ